MLSEKFWSTGLFCDKQDFLPVLGKFGQKNQNFLFKVEFAIYNQ